MRRGGQFDFYSDGKMTGFGSIAGMGGAKGSGYAPVAGFDANTGDGIDLIFNEVEVINSDYDVPPQIDLTRAAGCLRNDGSPPDLPSRCLRRSGQTYRGGQ